jgi:hypothetical protein
MGVEIKFKVKAYLRTSSERCVKTGQDGAGHLRGGDTYAIKSSIVSVRSRSVLNLEQFDGRSSRRGRDSD